MHALASALQSPPDARPSALPAGCVLSLTADHRHFDSDHEHATRAEAARRLAMLKGVGFRGEFKRTQPREAPTYFVPSDTLTADAADALDITDEHDLFGGVVPHAFVGTKVITHPLVFESAARPLGWNPAFADRVAGSVLRGYSAFSHDEALIAGKRLLDHGDARVKPACATGGRGQTVVRNVAALEHCVGQMSEDELRTHGVVIEENLSEPVITLSVGQIVVGGLRASYHGVQRMTRNNHGHMVYGGSDLTLVRGDFDALLALDLAPNVRLGIEQSRDYHQAAEDCFPGFFASRINYDVAQGLSPSGEQRSGVLEQSWRMGGATGAEIAGLECFRDHPDCHQVWASCFEVHGTQETPPGATVYFRGNDKVAGELVKYTVVSELRTDAHAS
ncbi:DUF3182 family protein [Variovorax robiniae]|uniref:DUF3182 family protein n=1 Tax=Variovorax robiniae TaxID=1836199 RepID=A0ABU8X050_9BURK